jgi:hypothetical protein
VFGPIFATGVNVPGRQLYNYETILGEGKALNGNKCQYSDAGKPLKHIDVAVITNQDVTASSLGRSDNDTFNIFSIFNTSLDAELWRFALREIIPIINSISVMRHGVRGKESNTKFANFSRDFLCNSENTGVDTSAVRRQLVRWALLMDHWSQHNIEYLSGTITMRGRPDIRVGYRLDWVDRHESYYVEQVSHEWSYPGALRTTVQVTRGQRNDPFPAYIPPTAPPADPTSSLPIPLVLSPVNLAERERLQSNASSQFVQKGGGDHTVKGRMAQFFMVMDTDATLSSVGSTPDQHSENTIDEQGNADGGGIAIYSHNLVSYDPATADTQIKNSAIPNSGNSNPSASQRIPE